VIVAAVITAVLVGAAAPRVWRLYHPTMDFSTTQEHALDLWARRRELVLSWRACDDRAAQFDGWHLCRMSIAGSAPVEIWCAGDAIGGVHGCAWRLRPRDPPPGWSPYGAAGESAELRQALGVDPKHPDTSKQPSPKGPGGIPDLSPDPNAPPEQGGPQGGRQHATPGNTGAGLPPNDDDLSRRPR